MNRSRLIIVLLISVSLLLLLEVSRTLVDGVRRPAQVVTVPPLSTATPVAAIPPAPGGVSVAVRSVATLHQSVSSAAIPLPGPMDQADVPPDLLLFTQNLVEDTTRLIYLASTDGAVRWESPALKMFGMPPQVIPGPALIYLLDETRLLALDRASGRIVWEAALADTLPPDCPDCLQLADDYLIALTRDGTLQSIAAANGLDAWSHQLTGTPRQLRVIGNQIATLRYQPTDPAGSVLELFNAADGTLVQRSGPACAGLEARSGDAADLPFATLLVAPDNRALYLLADGAGAGFSRCVQRVDATTGAPVWSRLLEDPQPATFPEHQTLLADAALYVSVPGGLTALDLHDGHSRSLIQGQEYGIRPLAARDGHLLIAAVAPADRQSVELWGLDAALGERRWRYPLQATQWRQAALGPGDWTGHLVPDGFALAQQLPNQLQLETLNLADGTRSGVMHFAPRDGVALCQGIAWEADMAWLTFQRLYAVDLGEDQVVYTWPETDE
jgi:outer membrane protein assembly factor BamB